MNDAILIFTRVPLEGKVKTRLAFDIGKKRALNLYLDFLESLSKKIEGYSHLVFYEGSQNPGILRSIFPNAYSYNKQKGKNFGEKIIDSFERTLEMGFKNVCCLAVDCPDIEIQSITDAFECLNNGLDVVLGPTLDGGFYLAGFKKESLACFPSGGWETNRLLNKILENINKKDLSYCLLKKKRDIDTKKDLLEWKSSK